MILTVTSKSEHLIIIFESSFLKNLWLKETVTNRISFFLSRAQLRMLLPAGINPQMFRICVTRYDTIEWRCYRDDCIWYSLGHLVLQKSVVCENRTVLLACVCHVVAFNAHLNIRQQARPLNLTCLLANDCCCRCCRCIVDTKTSRLSLLTFALT